MKPKENHISSLNHPESVLSRFCTAFLEAGWIAAAVLSALFMNIFTKRMFEADKVAVIRSIAILMLVAWLIKTIEYRHRRKVGMSCRPDVTSGRASPLWAGLKYSIFLPAGLYLFSYLISTLTSVLPSTSFWGSYDRTDGLYTTLAYFVIFILAATHIRTRAQVERLITAIILASFPVMVYGLIQKLGWDPVSWETDPTKRIFSTLGNPIFFAAYLIMIVPLVLARLLQSRHKVSGLGYSLILLLQVVSIILTQSRGPLLGLISGVAFFFFIYALLYKKKVLLWGLVSGFILGTIFVVIFNLPNTPLKSLKKVPYLERLGRLNPSEGTARLRLILWGKALTIMRETYQPIFPNPELIDAHPWRFILGYGPESLGNIFYRHHIVEFVDYEGQRIRSDNCHNSLFQVFVTQGVFGLIAFLCLISGAIYLGLKTLKSTSNGLRILLLGIISAIVAHFVEGLFGLGIVVTYTHLWLFLALLHYFSVSPRTYPTCPTCPTVKQVSEGHTWRRICAGVFWAYLGVSVVIFTVVIKEYKSSSNIKAWITMIGLWIFLGILLGTISLYLNIASQYKGPGLKGSRVSSSFNLLGYLCVVIVAFFLIVSFNFNPILADGYYRISSSARNEAKRTRKSYYQLGGVQRRLLEKKSRVGLSPDGEKQLQSITEQRGKMLLKMFGLHGRSITYYQRALRLTPNEKTYFNGMGRNFLELAETWRSIKDWALAARDTSGKQTEINTEAPGFLNGPPSIKEIMDFSADQYCQFNQSDFFYCCVTVIREAYELEPTNYEQRITMAQIYSYGTMMSLQDRKTEKTKEYFNKAIEYYQLAKEASPHHPAVDASIKKLQRETGWER